MVIIFMEDFTKYYSYNQIIEDHDVLIMTQQEYLANKDKLDNPQKIVLVNRKGGPREPKIPKWFQSYKKEADERFEKIEDKLDESKAPKWFTSYMTKFEKDLWSKIDQKFKDFAKLNNLKYEENNN